MRRIATTTPLALCAHDSVNAKRGGQRNAKRDAINIMFLMFLMFLMLYPHAQCRKLLGVDDASA